tara:strand:- start:37659 stop:38513 length:855 start_codon:yes stop_codon:yes gene_type:complete
LEINTAMKTKSIKFTFIIVFYKNKKGLKKTLYSIVNNLNSIDQNLRSKFNILLVDSYSNDGSKELINNFKKDSAIDFKHINVERNGVYKAMDESTKKVNNKNNLIVFINSGDELLNLDPLIRIIINKDSLPNCITFITGINFPPFRKIIFFDNEASKKAAHQSFVYNPKLHKKYGLYHDQTKLMKKERMDLDYIFMKKVLKYERESLRINEILSLAEVTTKNASRNYKLFFKLFMQVKNPNKRFFLVKKCIIYFTESCLRFPLITFLFNIFLVMVSQKRIIFLK